MDTSRSTDWLGQARVFSGRPDPTWVVPTSTAEDLLAMWAELPSRQAARAHPPPLGYRGCLLQAPDGRTWESFGGQVTHDDGQLTQTRDDPDRRFERLLLTTAPANALPPFLTE
jgi:hypothetical protein